MTIKMRIPEEDLIEAHDAAILAGDGTAASEMERLASRINDGIAIANELRQVANKRAADARKDEEELSELVYKFFPPKPAAESIAPKAKPKPTTPSSVAAIVVATPEETPDTDDVKPTRERFFAKRDPHQVHGADSTKTDPPKRTGFLAKLERAFVPNQHNTKEEK